MKTIGSICLLLSTAVASMQVSATTGTIDFVGEVTATTCFASVDGGATSDVAADTSIHLPSVGASLLQSNGDVAGSTRFSIKVSSDATGSQPCAATVGGVTATDVYAFIESGTENNQDGRLNNTAGPGAANNVELQLLNSSGQKIIAGASSTEPWLAQNSTVESMANALNTGLVHHIQYYATGAASAGIVQGKAVFSLAYK